MRYTIDEARDLCQDLTTKSLKDLKISDSTEKYLLEVCDTDVDNVHNCLNIWLGLYQDVTGFDSSILYGYIKQRTIVAVILEAKELRKEFINSKFDYSIFPVGTPWFIFGHRFNGAIPIEGVLLILGFPKRLHFIKANLEKLAIEKLLNVNKEFSDYKILSPKGYEFGDWHFSPTSLTCSTTKQYTRILSPTVDFINHTKVSIYAMLRVELRKLSIPKPEFKKVNGIGESFYLTNLLDEDSFILPPRSTYELSRSESTYLEKYKLLSKYKDYLDQFIDMPDSYFIQGVTQENPKFVGRLMGVPKDVSSFRTVMPEEVIRQFLGYLYAERLSRFLKHNRAYTAHLQSQSYIVDEDFADDILTFGAIDITCQERNQCAAQLGSVTGLLATMDLSSASDTISVDLCKRILPEPEFSFLSKIRATHIEVNGRTIRSNIMFTMGFSATFITESRIYTAAGRVAVKLTWNFASKLERDYFKNINRALACTFSYGDDVILPSFAADAFRMICELCGFKVNVDKSYYETDCKYRESCGKEYYDGIDISSYYFPRGTSSSRLAELIGLQHKLYIYPTTNAFIIEKCSSYRKNLTFNSVGSPYWDIWSPIEPQAKFNSPYSMGNRKLTLIRYNPEERRDITVTWNEKENCYMYNGSLIWIYWFKTAYSSKRLYTLLPIHTAKDRKISVERNRKDTVFDTIWDEVIVEMLPTRSVDEEPYSQVTISSVNFAPVKTCSEDDDAIERLAYVMRLQEMCKRAAMTSDEYLEFMIDRDSNGSYLKHPYQDDFGIIDLGQNLRKSLYSKSSTKLIRKDVMR
jgi:hypothetical protein